MAGFHKGMVQVYWGDGKGKTTSALGTALRALGSGFSVHLVQFMKNSSGNTETDYPGEIISLEKFPNFSLKRFGAGSWVSSPSPEHIDEAKKAYSHLLSCLGKYDILIADEILYAVQFSLLSEQDVISLIKSRPAGQELILTGSHKAFPSVFMLADLVTEVKKIKHPYDSGITARKGIEY